MHLFSIFINKVEGREGSTLINKIKRIENDKEMSNDKADEWVDLNREERVLIIY